MTWVASVAYKLIDPFVVGTIAMFDVSAPSNAFRVDTCGHGCPCGHKLRNPRVPVGIAVVFRTKAFAATGTGQSLIAMFTSLVPIIGGAPAGERVSNARQGVVVYRDRPPSPEGAK